MENVVDVLNQVARRCHALGIGCMLENKLPYFVVRLHEQPVTDQK